MKIEGILLSFLIVNGVSASIPSLESLGLDSTRVKHLIVLMMENHSFDNMLGWLNLQNPEIDGLTGNECNYVDPQDTTSAKYCVTDQGALVDPDPDHSLDGTGWQIFGTQTVAAEDEHDPSKCTMGGFIAVEAVKKNNPDWAPHIMDCMSPDHVPIISTLAMEFALFDRFYAGLPGPTLPNRLFGMSASSNGYTTNDDKEIVLGWPQSHLYASLDSMGLDWRIYFSDLPTPMLFRSMRRKDDFLRAKLLKK
jgi:phospholipase C